MNNYTFKQFENIPVIPAGNNIDLIKNVDIPLKVELCDIKMKLSTISEMSNGELIPLNKESNKVLFAVKTSNGKTLFYGELVVIDGELYLKADLSETKK